MLYAVGGLKMARRKKSKARQKEFFKNVASILFFGGGIGTYSMNMSNVASGRLNLKPRFQEQKKNKQYIPFRQKRLCLFLAFCILFQTVAMVIIPHHVSAYSSGQTWTDNSRKSIKVFDLGEPGYDPFEFYVRYGLDFLYDSGGWVTVEVSRDGNSWVLAENISLKKGTTGISYGISIPKTYQLKTVRYIRFSSNQALTRSSVALVLQDYGDWQPPTPPIITLNPIASKVTVSLGGSTDNYAVKKYQYKLSGATNQNWVDGTSFEISNQGITQIEARAFDYKGNGSSVTTGTVYIDRTAPTAPGIILDRNGWYNGNKMITITHGQDSISGIQKSQYRINGGSWIDYIAPFVVSDGVTITARSLDRSGNIGPEASLYTQIDKTPPSKPTIGLSQSGFTNQDIMVTVTGGQDSYSGVLKSQYRVGSSGAWTDYTAPFKVSQAGATPIYARTLDHAGNISTEATATARILRTKPVKPAIVMNPVDWTAGSVAVTIVNPNSSEDGISYLAQYKIGETGAWTQYKTPLTLQEEGTKIYARVIDTATNISDEVVATARIDHTAPTEPTIQHAASKEGPGSVITIIGGSDQHSGVSKTEYRVGAAGAWTTYTAPFTINPSASTMVYARTIDRVGNASIEGAEMIEPDSYQQQLAEAIQAVEEAEASRLQSEVNGARGLLMDLRAVDRDALLKRLEAITVIPDTPQDITKPTAPVALSGVRLTTTSVRLSWGAATDDVGVTGYEIYNQGQLIGETRELKYDAVNLDPNGNYAFTVRAKDAAGNLSDSSNEWRKGSSSSYNYVYDSAGRLDYIESQGKVLFDYQYDKNGNLLRVVKP